MTTEWTRPPTIMDVAAAAGVSKSLVSLALRGESGVSVATRTRIMDAADRLGYRTNPWARSLVRGRSQIIGVLISDMRSGYHTDVARGIEDAGEHQGLMTVTGDGRNDAAMLRVRMERMVQLGVDGIIVVSGQAEPDVLEPAIRKCPIVVVGRPWQLDDRVGQVRNDDRIGARLAVHHLASLGHRRIAHMVGSPRAASVARLDAYRETMHGLGLRQRVFDDPAKLTVEVADGGENAPTAVFCANDRIATQLVGLAADAGVNVPALLSVVGYDNIDLASIVRPGLTTVDQPRRRMGELALTQLTNLLDGGSPRREVVSPTLVVRDTTAHTLASELP